MAKGGKAPGAQLLQAVAQKVMQAARTQQQKVAPAPPPGVPAPNYQTELAPHEVQPFQQWVARNKIPYNPAPTSDYDLTGYWRAMMAGDPRARQAYNPNARAVHFPDTWKTPFSPSFSNQSIYAPPDAPRWQGPLLVNKAGKVVFDDRIGRS